MTKMKRFLGLTATAWGVSIVLASPAMASDVVIDSTGPGSVNTVSIDTTSSYLVENTTIVGVSNTNSQSAESSGVMVEGNTSVDGPIGSGDAMNASGQDTTVVVDGSGLVSEQIPVVPSVQSSVPVGGASAIAQLASVQSGNVLGVAVGGMGAGATVLPSVGATVPVDVSALRAAWQSVPEGPAAQLVAQTNGLTATMFTIAAVLSLLGALGTGLYTRGKEGRI